MMWKVNHRTPITVGDPAAASWGDAIFTGESLQQERESPWAFTLTERVPEAFEIPLADWPEHFSGQSKGGISFFLWKRNFITTILAY